MSRPLTYTQSPLDKAGASRLAPPWQGDGAALRVVPVVRERSLVVADASPPRAVILEGPAAGAALARAEELVLLGHHPDGAAVVAAGLPENAVEEIAAAAGEGEFVDLRQTGRFMPAEEAALLAHARGMTYWHRRHRFCGTCGSATRSEGAGHARVCTDPACGDHHFPRTDPAVIMLVVDRQHCLLGRQAKWPPGMYSTLAGFVEPGETLEHAVAREIREEAGIEIADVTYMASQPWPFPSSLMLGFHARATSRDLVVDRTELEDARWWHRDEVAEFPDWDHAEDGRPRLPRKDSIARWLIERWLAAG